VALSLDELAALLGGEVLRRGGSESYRGVAALDVAGPDEVSFFGNETYRSQFDATSAGAVIVGNDASGGPDGCALVGVENPTLAFQTVIDRFLSGASRPLVAGVHDSAVVAPDVQLDLKRVEIGPGVVIGSGSVIGGGTRVEANAVIGDGVKIGSDCVIRPNTTITDGCVLGDRVIVHPNAVIGSDGYGYEQVDGRHVKLAQVGIVEIGDDVEIGAGSTIDRARFGRTVIGEGTKIDNLVQIAHNVVIGKHCLVVALTGIAGSAKLEDGVVAAAQVGIGGHLTVGAGAVLSARTGVTTSIEGGKTYSGHPARPIMEEQRSRAQVKRLPKLVERVKKLEEERD
jgi:UDP-3-O-[3-hydroxymyristoyl] glucosamine N-acyltransferase